MTIVPKNDNDELMILGSDGIFDVFPQSSVLADYA
jgi:serine/threonine protein phosphatase PrpC